MNDNKVLACVDPSRFAPAVADYAAWAACRLRAPLEFLHVIERHPELAHSQDHSGAIGLNAQENLLTQLSAEDEHRTRAAREAARVFLQGLRERAQAAGADPVDTRLRHGDIEETLAEQQEGARLLVLGRCGAAAETAPHDLGRHLEWVVRSVNRPVLAVPAQYTAPSRALLAFDGRSVTRRGVKMLAASALSKNLPIHVLMSGTPQSQGPGQLEWAQHTLQSAGWRTTSDIQPGNPETVIADVVKTQGIDLLVMGAYGHSPLRSLFLGSKTSRLLRSVNVATLLLRQ